MLNFGNKEFRNLQEQVLKNAQDIETLKGREDLQIVIVNELPAVGNPNYIYLVAKNNGESPDVYDEYIWLENEQRYEKIGGVSIDLTNYVTLDTEQTITGVKIFSAPSKLDSIIAPSNKNLVIYRNDGTTPAFIFGNYDGLSKSNYSITPASNNTLNLGSANLAWKDLYLAGQINFSKGPSIKQDSSNRIIITGDNGADRIKIGGETSTYCAANWTPDKNATYDLGSSDYAWKDLYITGSLKDGANTVSVADIASKVTSKFISGTFDANGESTIDTEQAGTPEGLFIFTYGNCQCFLRLTAAMVNSADTAPIRVSCPMIYNGATSLGWLNITKSGYILVLKVTDGTNHVDSGYSWTLTKTKLL